MQGWIQTVRPLGRTALTLLGLALLPAASRSAPIEAPKAEVRSAETVQETQSSTVDPRGWHQGTAAEGTSAILGPAPEPVEVVLPPKVATQIHRKSLVLYFSPTCPHCIHAMPELLALRKTVEADWGFVAVSSGHADREMLDAFIESFQIDFPVVHDVDTTFIQATQIPSTPSVLMMEPIETEDSAGPNARILDGMIPYRRGAAALLEMRLRPDPMAVLQRGDFVSQTTCGGCHVTEEASWMLTHHSIAYLTLYNQERTEETECVKCHVTGLGTPTGFTMGDHTSALADVTCESCHTASGPHDGDGGDPAATCVGCHDAEHSLRFEYTRAIPYIDHFRSDTLSEDDWRTEAMTLRKGEAPRPLLAFPAGPTQGAAACKSCHAKSYKHWKKSPHAGAFERLESVDRDKEECVICHATPTHIAELGKVPHAFRTEDGVGCESCHGPGEAHVADPTRENIIGLGESCAECVIEEICTRCHAKTWDPGWSLTERLEASKHR